MPKMPEVLRDSEGGGEKRECVGDKILAAGFSRGFASRPGTHMLRLSLII